MAKGRLIKIGNSHGVRIPKPLLVQAGLPDDVELEVQGNTIVIRTARHARDGWEEAFAAMAAAGDDRLLDDDLPASTWDAEEWIRPSDLIISPGDMNRHIATVIVAPMTTSSRP